VPAGRDDGGGDMATETTTVTNEQAATIRRLTIEALDSYPSLLPLRREHILGEVEDALRAIGRGHTHFAAQVARGLPRQKSRLQPVCDALLAAIGDAPLA
jgi:hypothetical protein